MRKQKIQTISLSRIQTTVTRSDVQTARAALSFAVGATVDVSGKVEKFVKRAGLCRLVIESDNAPGFVVFADCPGELEKIKAQKIRKGSLASVRGRLHSFGASAICMSDCRLR
jgi:hypothetical protein